MAYVIVFLGGMAVGVVYEKSLRAWKNRLERAAKAAKTAMAD